MRGIAPELFEAATATLLCITISIALALYIASIQPVQNVIQSEVKESKLIRAIYIDEYARNFVRYGMKFMLQAGAKELFNHGGIIPSQATVGGLKRWINITDTGIQAANLPLRKDLAIPIDSGNGVVYYQWCNQTISDPCVPIRIDDLTAASEREAVVEESMENEFSLTEYLSEFSRYTQLYPEITSTGQVIDLTDSDVSASGNFRVVIRVGGYAGVNSSENIGSSVSTDLLERVEGVVEFVEPNGVLDTALSNTDLCSSTTPQIHIDFFNNTLTRAVTTSVGTYDHWMELDASMSIQGNKRCIDFDTIHHFDPDNFKFRTELKKCQNCP